MIIQRPVIASELFHDHETPIGVNSDFQSAKKKHANAANSRLLAVVIE